MLFRTSFRNQIVAEFAPPPPRARAAGRVLLLCDGMPSMPRKQALVEFLAAQGYWVFYPRWRGAWESGGRFLRLSPERDLSDILDELPDGVREAAFGRRFPLTPREAYVVGGSFGGAAAILSALDPRVRRVVANCPVVDWRILAREERQETSNPSYPAYIREAFGQAYRLADRDWAKLQRGRFFNPWARLGELDGRKLLLFHAQDDPYIPWRQVRDFAGATGARLTLLRRGGHLSTERITRRYWRTIARFFSQGVAPFAP